MTAPASLPTLTTAETAARLGVTPQTLYAYVSRGLLARHRGPTGSVFDPLDVEAFAASRRPRSRGVPVADGHPVGSPLMTIDTDIALIEDERLYLRGRAIEDLAGTVPFEQVCRWLWGGGGELAAAGAETFDVAADLRTRLGAVNAALPVEASLRDRIAVAVTVLASLDPLRHDLSRSAVVQTAARLVGGLVAAVPPVGAEPRHQDGVAAALWVGLTGRRPGPAESRLLDAALVLLVDHDLAISTLAVRAAASARANPYAVVACGLAALDSPLHGSASRAAYAMLEARLSGEDLDAVVARTVWERASVPGFGHRIYRGTDPRWTALMALLPDGPAVAAAVEIVELVGARTGSAPNVDLGLATLAHACGLGPDAAELIFAIGRSGGWIAHALAEYDEPPLRLRPVGRYRGP